MQIQKKLALSSKFSAFYGGFDVVTLVRWIIRPSRMLLAVGIAQTMNAGAQNLTP